MTSQVVLHPIPLRHLLADRAGGVAVGLLRLGIEVQTAARRRCPVDTGRLRASIGVELTIGGRGPQVNVGSNVVYAPYVHNGTRYMPARPFLTDALVAVIR